MKSDNHVSELELSDGFVRLRRYRASDGEALYEAVVESLQALQPWYAWAEPGYSIEQARQFIQDQARWWQDGEAYNLAITDTASGRYCGGCLLNNINRGDRLANMAYWVRSSCTCRGMATAAARLLAKFGFDYLGLIRIEIVMACENLASRRVAEKAGAMREGLLRNRITVRDKVYDAIIYSLIPDDFR